MNPEWFDLIASVNDNKNCALLLHSRLYLDGRLSISEFNHCVTSIELRIQSHDLPHVNSFLCFISLFRMRKLKKNLPISILFLSL